MSNSPEFFSESIHKGSKLKGLRLHFWNLEDAIEDADRYLDCNDDVAAMSAGKMGEYTDTGRDIYYYKVKYMIKT